jgi:molybdopterin biosynthesis enzyme
VRTIGAIAKVLPQAGDDLSETKKRHRKERRSVKKSAIPNPKSEILVITGGVSVGKYDLTKGALSELGAEIYFQKVRLRPGKPPSSRV